MRLLLVCTGNTRRSPLAEAMARRMVAARGLDIAVSSAGTGAMDGAPASDGSLLVGLERGLDLTTHRARALTREFVRDADLVLCMDTHHAERVEELGGDGKTFLLTDHAAGRAAGQAGGRGIDDPHGGSVDGYRRMAEDVERELERVFDRLAGEQSARGSE